MKDIIYNGTPGMNHMVEFPGRLDSAIKFIEIELSNQVQRNVIVSIKIDDQILPCSELLFRAPFKTFNYIDLSIFKNIQQVKIESPCNVSLILRGINKVDLVEKELSCTQSSDLLNLNKIGVVCDSLTFNSLNGVFDVDYISSNTNINEIQPTDYDILLCDCTWNGLDNSWNKVFSNFTTGNNLEVLVKHFKEHNVPVVLYNKEDPVHFETFEKTYHLFDTIITSEISLVEKYKQLLPNTNILSTPFNINPINHNILGHGSRDTNNICFAGGFYNSFKNRSKSVRDMLDHVIKSNYTLDIFDRNFYVNRKSEQIKSFKAYRYKYECPKEYLPYILPPVRSCDVVDKCYKSYKFHLNLNTVTDSYSMCSRRAVELLGCNKTLITNHNNFLFKNFKSKLCSSVEDIDSIDNSNYDAYYYIHSNLTYEKLVYKIFNIYNIPIKPVGSHALDISQNSYIDTSTLLDNKSNSLLKFDKVKYYYDDGYISDLLLHTKYFNGNILINDKNRYNNFDIYDDISPEECILQSRKNSKETLVINNIYRKLYSDVYSYDSEYSKIDMDLSSIGSEDTFVVMCMWQRIELFEDILNNLESQNTSNKINLFVWNNNPEYNEKLSRVISNYKGNKIRLFLHNSDSNIGGIGRFVLTRYLKLNLSTRMKHVIFKDDDQVWDTDVIKILRSNYKVNTNRSFHWYGRIFTGKEYSKGYYTCMGETPRDINTNPKLSKLYLDYGATCTMIIDPEMFTDDRFFMFNKRYAFIEDLWMSFFAQKHYHIKLVNCKEIVNKVSSIQDGKNQCAKLLSGGLKDEFLNELRLSGGWQV